MASSIETRLEIPNLSIGTSNTMMPILGFGSGTAWYVGTKGNDDPKLNEEYISLQLMALDKGIFHLDTAQVYGMEKSVGEALKRWFAQGHTRDEIFITTKLHHTIYANGVLDNVKASLDRLGLDYVDLYLWHAPFTAVETGQSLIEIWKEFEKIKDLNLAKEIGLSNFYVPQLQEIFSHELKHPPVINQIEYHPYHSHVYPTVEFCQKYNITIESFGQLAPLKQEGPLVEVLENLSQKYGVSKASVIFRWVIDQGIVPITTTQTPSRIDSWKEIFTFQLSTEDLELITEIGKQKSYVRFWAKYLKGEKREKFMGPTSSIQ